MHNDYRVPEMYQWAHSDAFPVPNLATPIHAATASTARPLPELDLAEEHVPPHPWIVLHEL
jgi:hypothetical protein